MWIAKRNDKPRDVLAAVAALLGTLLVCGRAHAQAAEVLIHGGGKFSDALSPVWVVVPGSQPNTSQVLYRERFGETNWKSLSPIGKKTIAITNHSTDLVLLFEEENGTRTWARYAPVEGRGERLASGARLPKGTMRAIAGDRDSLWALAEPEGDPAATQPATRAATEPVEGPATRPVLPVLYHLDGNDWTAEAASLPEAIALGPDHVSMALVDRQPTVAVRAAPDAVRVFQYDPKAKAWAKGSHEVKLTGKLRDFKLLDLGRKPALWVWLDTDTGTVGRLLSITDANKSPPEFSLAPNPNLTPSIASLGPADVDFTVVAEEVWAVYRHPGLKKVALQRYQSNGSLAGQPAELNWAAPRRGQGGWLTVSVMAVLTLLILATLLRRKSATREDRADPDD